MKDNRIDELTQMFVANQDIETASAHRIAQKIANDDDVFNAALTWVATGAFGSQPNIEGHSPNSLSAVYRPTQVFTILLGLKRDPRHAKKMLQTYGPGSVDYFSTTSS